MSGGGERFSGQGGAPPRTPGPGDGRSIIFSGGTSYEAHALAHAISCDRRTGGGPSGRGLFPHARREAALPGGGERSEERRVGKECGS